MLHSSLRSESETDMGDLNNLAPDKYSKKSLVQ